MNRLRSTWQKSESDGSSRQAATSRQADIYTMNQEHPQPSPVEYESGDPDSWAETPTTNKNVEGDYDGDHVRRNEIGLGEMRDDTFNHKDSKEWDGGGKYDNARLAAERKASHATSIARNLLRTDNEDLVARQALDLMALPPNAIVATLKRLEKVSPDSLSKEAKFRRALACCKLASRILPDGVGESTVERLGSVLMSIDDPTLKTILKITAAARVAEEQEQQSQQGQEQQQTQQGQQEPEQAQAQQGQQEQEVGCEMSAADIQALDSMIAEEVCIPGDPIVPAPAAPAPELTQLFQPAVPAVPMMAAEAVAAEPQVAADIEFTEDDEDGRTASDDQTGELNGLFDDLEDVQAQRQIASAADEAGYGPSALSRTASSQGARKLGRVQASRTSSTDEGLGALWDRP